MWGLVISFSELFREAEILPQKSGTWYSSGYSSAVTQVTAEMDGLYRRSVAWAVSVQMPVGVFPLDAFKEMIYGEGTKHHGSPSICWLHHLLIHHFLTWYTSMQERRNLQGASNADVIYTDINILVCMDCIMKGRVFQSFFVILDRSNFHLFYSKSCSQQSCL